MSTQSNQPSPNQPISTCDDLRQLLPAYVIGATTLEEAQQIEALLPHCPEAADELKRYAMLTEGLASRVDVVKPPAHARQAFLDRVAAEAGAHPPAPSEGAIRRLVPPRKAVWGAVAAVFVILLMTNMVTLLRANRLESDFSSVQEEKKTILVLLNAEQLERVALQSTNTHETLARVFWSPEAHNGALYTDQFPPLDKTHTYQVWLIRGNELMSIGTFGIDASGEVLLTFTPDEDLHSFASIAVSVEPIGGSPLPTTDPMAIGEITAS